MNYSPLFQVNLYGLNNIFNDIVKLISQNNLPNKIMIKGPSGIGKSTMAFHLINYLFSLEEKHKYNLINHQIDLENKSFKLVSNNSHPNLHLIQLIDEKKKYRNISNPKNVRL